jgi:hypothetical protein
VTTASWARVRRARGSRTPVPRLPARCADRCSPSLHKAFWQGGCRSVVPSCTRSSQGITARPVSNLVSIGGFRSRSVADAFGAPVLRDQGPDRPAGHGKADQGLDPLHAIYGPTAPSRPKWRSSCGLGCPLVTVSDRCCPLSRGPSAAQPGGGPLRLEAGRYSEGSALGLLGGRN